MTESALNVLLVYGTRWGGTVDIANRIADTLRKTGCKVDVVDAGKKVPDVPNYDVVIVGS